MRPFIFLIPLLALIGCTNVNDAPPPVHGTINITVSAVIPKALLLTAMPGLVLRVKLPTKTENVHCHTSWKSSTCKLPVTGPIKTGDKILIEVNRLWADSIPIIEDYTAYVEKEVVFDGTSLSSPPATSNNVDITVDSTFTPSP